MIRPIATLACALVAAAGSAAAAPGSGSDALATYLVVLDGPGAAGGGSSDEMLAEQAGTRLEVGAGTPLYSWTTALNGYAVRLTPQQATQLAQVPGVAHVEPDSVHSLTSTPGVGASSTALAPGSSRAGRGVVVGVVDTGIEPDGPVFADSPALGRLPSDFRGTCPAAEGWSADDCTGKVLAARHYVSGFGADQLRTGAALSPYDDVGHGTQVASLAVGNADVSAREGRERLGRFSGIAPDARLAVYKACWQAPDPADDGCAASDLVTAIDQATSDGVDVLFLATEGGTGVDAVDLALLGAAEADVFVAAAAGNGRAAGHAQPWLTTVGSTTGPVRAGRLALGGGAAISGVMTSARQVSTARVVPGHQVPAPGFKRADARLCLPGSLDAARTAGRIVVCERGRIARIDKSEAVALADGAGMVLVSRPGEDVAADFHAVPTLHVTAAAGRQLASALRGDRSLRAALEPLPVRTGRARLADWSPRGRLAGAAVKPDLLAPGTALLAATTPAANGRRWDLISGSSASTALVAGLAARVRSQHPDWSAALVRSALMTSAAPLTGDSALRQGAGSVRPAALADVFLGYDVARGDYRRVLDGRWAASRLNLPSLLVAAPSTVHRTVTNLGRRATYWSSQAGGFRRHGVVVTPAAVRLAPGETARFTIRVTRRPGVRPAPESGWVAWLAADGTLTRIPVVVR